MAQHGIETPPDRDGEAGEPEPDILELGDDPELHHRSLGRLGLLVLATAAGLAVISLLLTTMAGGGLLDVLVLVLWLSSAALALGGLLLMATAGLKALATRASTVDRPT